MEASSPSPISLRATGRTRRRLLINRVAEGLATVAALAALAVLGWVIVSVLLKGISALNIDFFTKTQATFGESGGGIANALVGTPIMVALATGMALPLGVAIAIYVSEFARQSVAHVVRLALDVLNGVPSVVIGVFVFVLLVSGSGYSALKASVALAIIMLPLVARATMEVLELVPHSYREGSFALGVARWRTVLFVVLPSAFGGILTGTTLAVARAAGETAPIIFTSAVFANTVSFNPTEALASIPFTIFTYSEAPDKSLNDQAWAAAFVLMAFVLISSLTARFFLSRHEKKMLGR